MAESEGMDSPPAEDGAGRDGVPWRDHAVNIRLSLPFFDRRIYMTVVAGHERRDPERRALERNRYPLRTAANIFFVIGLATLCFALGLVALALHTTILEF